MELLRVDHVSKQFGELRAINDVSFSVHKNEILSIIGPNGAGKSTMLNLISKVDIPTSGQVIYKNVQVPSLRMDKLISLGIARTYQNVRLFEINDMNALDNVLVGMHHLYDHGFFAGSFRLPSAKKNERIMKEKAYNTLDFVGIADLAEQPVNSLSFGERRLVELCRALVSEPELIVMDEPAAGLNDAETDKFAELVQVINRRWGITVLLVEHHMGLVMNISNRIVVLNYGQKIAEGEPGEINENSEVKKAYLGVD